MAARTSTASLAEALVQIADGLNRVTSRLDSLEAERVVQSAPTAATALSQPDSAPVRTSRKPADTPARVGDDSPSGRMDRLASALQAQIAGTGQTHYSHPERKLARLVACRDHADSPDRAFAWYSGSEPMPDWLKAQVYPPRVLNGDAARKAETAQRDAGARDVPAKRVTAGRVDQLAQLASQRGWTHKQRAALLAIAGEVAAR